jgi:hypothetical protein
MSSSASASSFDGSVGGSADENDDEAGSAGDTGDSKQFGSGSVSHPTVVKIKMDGPVEKIGGATGAIGFTIRVPNRKTLSPGAELARKDKRIQSVHVANKTESTEITFKFKDGVPPFVAKAKGDHIEVAFGRADGPKKVAKAHEKGAKKKKGNKK